MTKNEVLQRCCALCCIKLLIARQLIVRSFFVSIELNRCPLVIRMYVNTVGAVQKKE